MTNAKMLNNARTLRINQTDAEIRIWYYIRAKRLNGYKFRRQHPIQNYIVDFACYEPKLIIELDGSQHFEQEPYDCLRTKTLETLGFKVIRFLNTDVLLRTNEVLSSILMALQECIPPSP